MQAVKLLQADDNHKLRARVAELEPTLFAVPKIEIDWTRRVCILRALHGDCEAVIPNGVWKFIDCGTLNFWRTIAVGGADGLCVSVVWNGVYARSNMVLLRVGSGESKCNSWLLNKLLDELEPITDGQSEANCQVWAEFKAAARGLF